MQAARARLTATAVWVAVVLSIAVIGQGVIVREAVDDGVTTKVVANADRGGLLRVTLAALVIGHAG